MSGVIWERLPGTVFQDNLAVGELIQSGARSAMFRGQDLAGESPLEVSIQIFETANAGESRELLGRFREVIFLNHPNLLRILRAGSDESQVLAYVVSEPIDNTLIRFAAKRPPPEDAARKLTAELVSALAYLHAENMVFCNLRLESVCRVGRSWKLADFSQMRLSGQENAERLKQAFSERGELPPEIDQGLISPALDVWSLGALLQTLLKVRESALPPPFDAIARDCLAPLPERRITPAEIAHRLGTSLTAGEAYVPEPEAPSEVPLKNAVSSPKSWRKLLWPIIGCAVILTMCLWIAGFTRKPGPQQAEMPASPEKTAIQSVLTQWVESVRNLNALSEADCYAPVVDIWFAERRVSRERIYQYKKAQFDQAGTVRRFEIGNVQITRPTPEIAQVSFDKTWDFGATGKSSGSQRGQFTLAKFDGNWKIVTERDIQAASRFQIFARWR